MCTPKLPGLDVQDMVFSPKSAPCREHVDTLFVAPDQMIWPMMDAVQLLCCSPRLFLSDLVIMITVPITGSSPYHASLSDASTLRKSPSIMQPLKQAGILHLVESIINTYFDDDVEIGVQIPVGSIEVEQLNTTSALANYATEAGMKLLEILNKMKDGREGRGGSAESGTLTGSNRSSSLTSLGADISPTESHFFEWYLGIHAAHAMNIISKA
uniref:Uncharacterized protein n=1 Tax=Timema douglasi TaxID=61478 RepID=A0A7R8VSU5_TIMDO|nr:unnamed protein product [Timema douglasi]